MAAAFLTLAPSLTRKQNPMLNRIVLFCFLIVMLASCARAVTPSQAAHGSFKKCRSLR